MVKQGKLTVISGPMFSGKTGKLVAMAHVYTKMGLRVLTLKPAIDTRYSTKPQIVSHDQQTAQAILCEVKDVSPCISTILKFKPNYLLIDEAQFFDSDQILAAIETFRDHQISVVASGLLFDYRRQPFGAMPTLMGLATEKLELMAICQKCGGFARHTERVSGGEHVISVGAANHYIAVCEHCHKIYKPD